ncbi:hypothetical protein L1889_17615 [Paenalcaligenes niemegkensis]|uniref:hypothetical protein n=1 Tax=Paenalcaligenes niemegkensis TaxID=2895469 RepID=UPI001EE89234|nr:hypothetical protein [Paenalcaligenes niemegkensis]MCQ9618273.1 hypothetical protein [Paenalcaligenes niemegkensis]
MVSLHPHIKKAAFVVDIRGWAFDTIARSVQQRLAGDLPVTIFYWDDYADPSKLVKDLAQGQFGVVHFFSASIWPCCSAQLMWIPGIFSS